MMLHRIPYVDDMIEKIPLGGLLSMWLASYLVFVLVPFDESGTLTTGFISMVMLVVVCRSYVWKYITPLQKEHQSLLEMPNASR